MKFHSVIIPHFKVDLTPLIEILLILDSGKQIRSACLTEVSDYCISTVASISEMYDLKRLNGISDKVCSP